LEGLSASPRGACAVSIEVAEACQQLEQGAVELDMVMKTMSRPFRLVPLPR